MANKNSKVKVKSSCASEQQQQKEEDLRTTVSQLRAELDEERRTCRQLRREKALEVQKVRDEEQTRSSVQMKDLAAKLHQEKQQEVELQKEQLKCKLESDSKKVTKLKDQEIKKLKQDLARCQDELKEEVTKRGLSTSARGTFELERNKLLQEVKELNASKKQLESALVQSSDSMKQKNVEIRQLQDSCKLELAKVEKEANIEVKKLLEELKTKDNLLVMMDRNQYPEKLNVLKNRVENLSVEELLMMSREVERMSKCEEMNKPTDSCVVQGGCALQTIGLQKKLYDLEKQMKFANALHRSLTDKNNNLSAVSKSLEQKLKSSSEQINSLNCELQRSKAEIDRLNEVVVSTTSTSHDSAAAELQELQQQYADLQQTVASLRHDCQEKDRRIALLFKSQQKRQHKYERKMVRFFLPDDKEEPETSLKESSNSNDTDLEKSEQHSDEMLIQSIHKDYEILMEEHLKLEKYCANLIQSQKSNPSPNTKGVSIEKESFDVALAALEEKLQKADEREQMLESHLREVCDQNEELEFRILELEECAEKKMGTYYAEEDVELMEKNKLLETQVIILTQRLASYEAFDLDALEKDAQVPYADCRSASELLDNPDGQPHRLSVENLRKLTSSLSDSDDENPMVQSFSTMTSGFDEISCISLELDDKLDVPELNENGVVPELTELTKEVCLDGQESEQHVVDKMGPTESLQTEHADVQPIKDLVGELNKNPSDDDTAKKPFNLDIQEDSPLSTDKCQFSALSSQDLENLSDSIPCNSLRLKDLQDQLDILERNDHTYVATIEALTDIEKQLQLADFGDNDEVKGKTHLDTTSPRVVTDEQFWMSKTEQLRDSLLIVKNHLTDFITGYTERTSVFEKETQIALENCAAKINDSTVDISRQMSYCAELSEQMEWLEQREQIQNEEFEARFRLLGTSSQNISEPNCHHQSFYSSNYNAAGSIKSLKLFSLEAVNKSFREDFEELKYLTDTCLKTMHVDDNAEEADTENVKIDSDQEENIPASRSKRNLVLNTDLPYADQRFDFLSPTSFESEWANGSHLETINHCLIQQIQDLIQERDTLQELVYKDNNIISDMTQQLCYLDESEKSLHKLISDLEISEQETKSKMSHLEAHCSEMKMKLKRMESTEASLKMKLEAYDKAELDLNRKIQSFTDLLQSNATKFKETLADLESEKSSLEHRVEELSELTKKLEGKETMLKQRVKALETAEVARETKLKDAEAALSAAYDEISRIQRQKDSIAQQINQLKNENSELKNENSEMKESISGLTIENDRLSETEAFLKESNRKMWLSLQVTLDERECSRRTSLRTISRDDKASQILQIHRIEDKHSTDSCPVSQSDQTNWRRSQEQAVQKAVSWPTICCNKQPVVVIERASLGFRKALQFLKTQHPRVYTAFIATAAVQSEEEDEMAKFISTMQFKCSSDQNAVPTRHASSSEYSHTRDGGYHLSADDHYLHANDARRSSLNSEIFDCDAVKGEEKFWATVEDLNDVYDVRAADRSQLWRKLEELIGVNTEDLEMSIEFRDIDSTAHPQSTNPQPKSIRESDTRELDVYSQISSVGESKKISIPPPLPASPPPGSDSSDTNIAASHYILDQTTQTETFPHDHSQPIDQTFALRMQLEQKDKNLLAKMHEVDRLTQEMRRWQQKAVEASEEAAKYSAALGVAKEDDINSGKKSSKQQPRLEPYVSQIPISVRQAVDHYKSIDLRSSQSSRPLGGGSVSPGQGSVHTSGSSLSKSPSKFPSLIPKPIGERNLLSPVRQRDGSLFHTDATVGRSADSCSGLQASAVAAASLASLATPASADIEASAADTSAAYMKKCSGSSDEEGTA